MKNGLIKSSYKYILLDWDGNLAKTLQIWMGGYKHIFPKYNIFPTEDEIVEKVFGRWDGPKNFGIDDFEGFYKELMPFIEPLLEKVGLYDGVSDTLSSLKGSGKKLALLTSSEKRYVLKAVEHNKLDNIFDFVLAGDEVKKHKPDPECVFTMIKALKGERSATIIVGDSDKDILAGQAAGIDTILFLPEENKKFYSERKLLDLKPTFVIRRFSEILNIL